MKGSRSPADLGFVMHLLHGGWIAEGLLSGGLSAVLAWLCLVNRFSAKGRLLGSHRSAGLALAICLVMSGLAVVTNIVLPGAASSHLRPLAVAAIGTGVAKRKRRQQQEDGAAVLTIALSLGVARLLERLGDRLADDRADWCDAMMEGLNNPWQARMFIHAVKLRLLAQAEAQGSKPRQKLIEELHEEARQSFADADAECRKNNLGPIDDWKAARPSDQETFLIRQVYGQADHRCKFLLCLAHDYGRRTDDAQLRRLKAECIRGTATQLSPA